MASVFSFGDFSIEIYHIWLIVGLLLIVGEMFTGAFVLLWFGIGSFISALCAYLNASFMFQLIIFCISSLLLFFASRTIFHSFFMGRHPGVVSNVDAMIGRQAEVVDAIGPGVHAGTVKVGGEVWNAISPGYELTTGTQVRIEEINGLKLKVRALEPHLKEGGKNQ